MVWNNLAGTYIEKSNGTYTNKFAPLIKLRPRHTFTHSESVDIDRDKKNLPKEKHRVVDTKELDNNIMPNDPKEKGKKTRVVPIVYQGKRNLLGNKRENDLTNEQVDFIKNKVFYHSKQAKTNRKNIEELKK